MKRIMLLSLIVALSFIACDRTPPIYWDNVEVSREESNFSAKISYPYRFGGEPKSTELINNTIEGVIKEGMIENCPECSIDSALTIVLREKNSETILRPLPYTFNISGEVCAMESITSVAIRKYYYTGGANGYAYDTFLNFESKTGRQIPNSALNIDTLLVKERISKFLKSNYPSEGDRSTFFAFVDVDNPPMPKNIFIDSVNFTFFYNRYEIAPRAVGAIELSIPIEDVVKRKNHDSN